ncbi:putative outer membrane protein A [hydrothermal vent metagenome]|uniref:Putative outer membrane protein A n=1 Tax=hydrothermal vent metagenome TaxID=652676 RepID=A0A1W1EEW3_9ZZZZ
MKKNIIISLTLLAALNTAAVANQYNRQSVPASYHQVPQSQSHFYLGGAYGLVNADDNYFYTPGVLTNTDIDYDSFMFQAGYELNPYVAVEFRYWLSVGDGDYSLSDNHVPASGSYSDFDAWGIYLKPQYPITPEFTIYGLMGMAGVKVDGEQYWKIVDDVSFSWGLGASFDITPEVEVFVDYVRLYDDTYTGYYDYYGYSYNNIENTVVDSFNFGVTYKF